MNGIFQKPPRSRIPVALFLISIGGFLCVRFSEWTITEIRTGKIASTLFALLFAIFGFCVVAFGGFILFSHCGAYFRADNEIISGKNGMRKPFSFRIDEIDILSLEGNFLTFRLKGGKFISTRRLENAKEIYDFLHDKLPPREQPDTEQCRRKHASARCRILLIKFAIALLCILLFVGFVLFLYLTYHKLLSEFDRHDTTLAVMFTAITGLSFMMINQLAKALAEQKESASYFWEKWVCAEAYLHRADNLDIYVYPMEVLYFADYSYRIVLCGNDDETRYGYMLERFHLKLERWIMCFDQLSDFADYEDMLDEIEGRYSDVEFSTNKLKFAQAKAPASPSEDDRQNI